MIGLWWDITSLKVVTAEALQNKGKLQAVPTSK